MKHVPAPPCALLTDFGTRDWFVASMKGVVLATCPGAALVDITHEIAPGDIRSAAFVLGACDESFPLGTVFVVVVDPGVGSARRALAAQAGGRLFVAPDNGVLSLVLRDRADAAVHEVTNRTLFRLPVSATFHGRDIFAPVGARLLSGMALEEVGPRCADYGVIGFPRAAVLGTEAYGCVEYIDRFGNALTNIDAEALARLPRRPAEVVVRGTTIDVCAFYQERAEGEAVALVNSSGRIEIAVNGGSAAARFGLRVGAEVVAR